MFCTNCGNQLQNNANFCPKCGTKKSFNVQTVEPVQNAALNQTPYTAVNEDKAAHTIHAAQPAVAPMAVTPQSHNALLENEQYCFSCRSVVKKEAGICPKCGVNQNQRSATNAINVYCSSCGESIKKEAVICPFCGVEQGMGVKKWITALLLIIFTGCGHRFYIGKIGTAILMLLLQLFSPIFCIIGVLDDDFFGIGIVGGLMYSGYFIWWIVDFIRVCTRNLKDKRGYQLKKT